MNLWEELNAGGKAVAIMLFIVIIASLTGTAFSFAPSAGMELGTGAAASPALSIPEPKPIVQHLKTPESVKGIYMTACIAGSPKLRARLLDTIKDTEINSIIIDVKDYTGTIAYDFPGVNGPRGSGCRVADFPKFLEELHKLGIYAIARITVFQDPLYARAHPDVAVQSIANPGMPWKDKKGLSYIDPNQTSFWKYILAISKGSYDIGFDEINFDYIRFPSDGNISDMSFATPEGLTRRVIMIQFFDYLDKELRSNGVVTSADIFGQATVDYGDLGIGQVLEDFLPYFDYISPMTYPSHFMNGFMGFDNPAEYPYEIIKNTMIYAVERTITASSSVDKLRPWFQAFDLGADYTPEMVKAQMKGAYDAGVNSWLLWDAANTYRKEEL